MTETYHARISSKDESRKDGGRSGGVRSKGGDMPGFKIHLEEYRPLASSAELDVIEFLLSHPKEAMGVSTHRLAELTFTSPSTIVRLSRKLGFTGYREFQHALIYDMAVTEKSQGVMSEGLTSEDTTAQIIQKVTAKNAASLALTRDGLDPDAVDQAVDLISGARMIYLFGVGASLLVAHDLQLKLLRLGLPCTLCDDFHAQLLCAKSAGREDVAVAVSYSGLTVEVLDCVRTAREGRCKVISITRGSFDSPLIGLSDVTLGVAATELLRRTGAMSSRIAQLNVVDILFMCYVRRTYERSIWRMSSNWIQKGSGPLDGQATEESLAEGAAQEGGRSCD